MKPIDSDDARLPQQLCTVWASSQSTPIDRDDARLLITVNSVPIWSCQHSLAPHCHWTVMMPDRVLQQLCTKWASARSTPIDSDDARLLLQLCTIWASARSTPIDSDDARLLQQLCTIWASAHSTSIDSDDARLLLQLCTIWASAQSTPLTVMMPDCSYNSVLYGLQHSPPH